MEAIIDINRTFSGLAHAAIYQTTIHMARGLKLVDWLTMLPTALIFFEKNKVLTLQVSTASNLGQKKYCVSSFRVFILFLRYFMFSNMFCNFRSGAKV